MGEYKEIIEKIKKYLQKRGLKKNELDNAFTKCLSEDKMEALTALYSFYSYHSTIYHEEDGELLDLQNYKVPEKIIDFYRNYEPNELPCLQGGVYLLDLEAIKQENSDRYPGALLIKYGLITIASTIGGNAICLDLNKIVDGEPRVVYADNKWFYFNDEERKVEFYFYQCEIEEDDEFLSHYIIDKYLPQISNSFSSFLCMLGSEDEWEAEDYGDSIQNCK